MVNNFVYNITHDKKQGPSLLDYQILSIKKKKKKCMAASYYVTFKEK